MIKAANTNHARIRCMKRGYWKRELKERWFDFNVPGEITYQSELLSLMLNSFGVLCGHSGSLPDPF